MNEMRWHEGDFQASAAHLSARADEGSRGHLGPYLIGTIGGRHGAGEENSKSETVKFRVFFSYLTPRV